MNGYRSASVGVRCRCRGRCAYGTAGAVWRPRKGEEESRALARHTGTLYPDGATHGFDVGSANGKSQSGAANRGSQVTFEPDKALEEQRNLVRGNTEAVVADCDLYHLSCGVFA